MSKTIISQLARRAQCLLLSVSIFTAIIVALLSLFIPQNIVAQFQSPAIEADAWGYIKIGQNDEPNNDPSYIHRLTFGKGNVNNNMGGNVGLWEVSGSADSKFVIGHTHNTIISTATGYTLDNGYTSATNARQMIVIDHNMNVGIDKWDSQIGYKLDVNGYVHATNGVLSSSDRRYKREIEPISNLDNLFKINAVQYKPSGEAFAEQLEILKKEGSLSASDLATAEAGIKSIIEERNSDNTIHYGFIAQELRDVYPNLVSEDKQGFLSINYTELIPVLVDAIKELNNKIEVLESRDEKLLRNSAQSNTTSAVLYQNNPNPFDTQTEIKYYIPTVATNATICVYDMVGAEVLKMEIRGRESGSIVIDANQLRAGMYMYALLVDGKEIDVKRMILTGK